MRVSTQAIHEILWAYTDYKTPALAYINDRSERCLTFHSDEKPMMADSSKSIPTLPKETARAANASFGRSNFHILIGEHLETILEDIDFKVSSSIGRFSSIEVATLALITFFQFLERLTDIQAADAIRTRTDWKFALHLSLIPAIFHESALCEFRQRILIDFDGQLEFQRLTARLSTFIPSFRNSFPDLKSLDVVAFVCSVNRLSRAQLAMHQALGMLAFKFPEWLRKATLPHWYGRYTQATPRLDVAMLLGQQRFLMEEIGADIHHLLDEVHHSGSPDISELPEIKVLDQIWTQQFQALNLNHWPEKLTADHCKVCPYKAGRRN
jgi:transposase